MTAPRPVRLIALALSLAGCGNPLALACTSEGARWEVSPSSVEIGVGARAEIQVIQVSCSGRKRRAVYPRMTVTDTLVAFAINTERVVQGRAAGSTTMLLTGDNGNGPAVLSVVVK
jgi:hypothetical protein